MEKINYETSTFESIATCILNEYDSTLIDGAPRSIPIEDIIEKKFGLNIEYQYIRNNARIFGEIVFNDGFNGIYDK